MKSFNPLTMLIVVLSTLACSLTAPTPTPDDPIVTEEEVTSIPILTPFTGTWKGDDPLDGSAITVSLTQTGTTITGTFSDTYSEAVRPGYAGNGTGTANSAATGQITFNLTRGDGTTINATFDLALSNLDNTLVLNCENGCPITLQK